MPFVKQNMKKGGVPADRRFIYFLSCKTRKKMIY